MLGPKILFRVAHFIEREREREREKEEKGGIWEKTD